MIVRLLWPDHDFDPKAPLAVHAETLVQDLELGTLFAAMAGTDEFLLPVVRAVLLSSLSDPETVRYRQEILTDCVNHPDVVRELYGLSLEAHRAERDAWGFGDSPDSILYRSRRLLEGLLPVLERLRSLVDTHRGGFHSTGFVRLFEAVQRELDREFFDIAKAHVERLEFPKGALISAKLGSGNKGIDYVLRTPHSVRRSWSQRLLARRRSPFTFELGERDDAGRRALSELTAHGIATTAQALDRSTGHVVHFFAALRAELGFYLTCLNLRSQLVAAGLEFCLPAPLPAEVSALSAEGLYEICLALHSRQRVVANELAADGARLILITGPNQGGKSTFLRSLGVSLLMLHAGMFVPARRMSASVGEGLFTHFKREEDTAMESGKFDEELKRMSRIVAQIRSHCFLLCNESFSSTNEREGSEIADQTVRALLEGGVRVFYVTHLFDLAERLHVRATPTTLFLRAERTEDGKRTFRMVEAPPLPTSFGEDLYREVFANAADARSAG